MILRGLLLISVLGLISSTIYLLLILDAGYRFRKAKLNPTPSGKNLPRVTVLKPLHGMEPRLKENLESFFLQDYPDFEIIFGARRADDPALPLVEALLREYPQVQSQVVLSGEPAYPNAKVFALEKMLTVATASFLVITDSDVCVGRDCLRRVVTPLLDSENGVVTCMYKGMSAGGFWSKLEALGMSIEMSSGVLAANRLEGMRFALGPTMATRMDVLESIGGIAKLGHYCADDYLLGNLAYGLGRKVVLSDHIVGHVAMNTSAGTSFRHQVRWMRSTRFSRGAGHAGTGLTYAIPFGLLGLASGVVRHNLPLAFGLFGWAVANRVIQAVAIGWGVIGDAESLSLCWLYPLRDLTGFFVWCASFLGNEVLWRNERYRLLTDGKMVRVLTSKKNG